MANAYLPRFGMGFLLVILTIISWILFFLHDQSLVMIGLGAFLFVSSIALPVLIIFSILKAVISIRTAVLQRSGIPLIRRMNWLLLDVFWGVWFIVVISAISTAIEFGEPKFIRGLPILLAGGCLIGIWCYVRLQAHFDSANATLKN